MPDLTELAPAIVALIDGYEYQKEAPWLEKFAYLKGADEREIVLKVEKDRLEIYGHYPADGNTWPFNKYIGEIPPRITVSMARTPAAIAKDLKRRFMKHYEAYYQLALTRQQEQRAYDRNYDATLEMIGDLLGVAPYGLGAKKNCFSAPLHSGYGKIEVRTPDNIQLELSLKPDLARFLLQSLMEYLTTGEPT
jgi:hypothetical protein